MVKGEKNKENRKSKAKNRKNLVKNLRKKQKYFLSWGLCSGLYECRLNRRFCLCWGMPQGFVSKVTDSETLSRWKFPGREGKELGWAVRQGRQFGALGLAVKSNESLPLGELELVHSVDSTCWLILLAFPPPAGLVFQQRR